MGARKSRIGRKPIEKRFQEIPEAEELQKMLSEGHPVADVADILQKEWGHFPENTRGTMMSLLYQYRKKLRGKNAPPVQTAPTETVSVNRRAITKVIRKRYDKVLDAVDRMVELEALYLVQRDRLEWLLEEEQKEGIPYPNMSRDFVAATNTLLAHLKVEMAYLGVPEKEKETTVSFDRYSEATAKALANPESRRRVVSILERIQRNAALTPPSCDESVSCSAEVDIDVPGEPVVIAITEK